MPKTPLSVWRLLLLGLCTSLILGIGTFAALRLFNRWVVLPFHDEVILVSPRNVRVGVLESASDAEYRIVVRPKGGFVKLYFGTLERGVTFTRDRLGAYEGTAIIVSPGTSGEATLKAPAGSNCFWALSNESDVAVMVELLVE